MQTRAAASHSLGCAGCDPALSTLYARVSATDPNLRMPLGGQPMPADKVEKLRRWVELGAPWPAHWSHQPLQPRQPTELPVSDANWLRSPIDRFILSGLDRAGIAPAADASPTTLLRRVSLDLTGLPPTLEQLDAFLSDTSPNAFETVVERLLASPQFGERWGRHWLDQARYAESDGYQKDSVRMNAWRFRDWVVDAFNSDLPFDEFTLQQLAGDLMPGATALSRLGTAFHTQTLLNAEPGVDPEEDRVKRVVDRAATVGNTWLGLTLQCAQCHGHPYDALSQVEFYRLFAFFNRSQEGSTQVPVSGAPADTSQMDAEVLQERTGHVPTYLLVRGNFLTPDTAAGPLSPGTPGALPPFTPRGNEADRLDLARWLIDTRNPLTPRVLVNTIWYHLFGRGIVASLGDFGTRGELPSHPELLDWLAGDLIANGWRQKRVIKQIVLSRAYRQSSVARPETLERDPTNALVSRQARVRLEAEPLIDSYLSVSGLLSPKRGGPSVFPPLPGELRSLVSGPYSNFEWPDSTGEDRYRRSLYTFHKRSASYPSLSVFDWPVASASVNERARSLSPLQALTTLHDITFLDAARALAQRVQVERPGSAEQQLVLAFRRALSREPNPSELAQLVQLLADNRQLYAQRPGDAAAVVGSYQVAGVSLMDVAAWVATARVITNLDEFLTRE